MFDFELLDRIIRKIEKQKKFGGHFFNRLLRGCIVAEIILSSLWEEGEIDNINEYTKLKMRIYKARDKIIETHKKTTIDLFKKERFEGENIDKFFNKLYDSIF